MEKQQNIQINVLVHRTYMGAHIQLRVYDDKLSIWNEGGLPFGLTVEDLKGEHNSRPRNPKIARACFMSGYIDTWGRGTLKIYNSSAEHGLPDPDILEKDGGFMVIIYKAPKVTEEIDATGGQVSGQVGGQVGGQDDRTIKALTDRQKVVYKLIVDNPKISRKQLAEKLKINESAVQKHIQALKKKGVIERESETTGQWTIIVKI